MMFHDGKVDGVAGRHLPMPQDNLFRTLGNGSINRQHLIDDIE